MITIKKIILHNFKRFTHLELDVNPTINILIGDNESGKSTILQAIDLVARGSRTRVENLGIDKIFNVQAVSEFMAGNKDLNTLPEIYIELYFLEDNDSSLYGECNSQHQSCSGIRMKCQFNHKYGGTVREMWMRQPQNITFPFEFYDVQFDTFSGTPFMAYNKKLYSLMIDNSAIGNPMTMRGYVSEIYRSTLSDEERVALRLEYRNSKKNFEDTVLARYNATISPRKFSIRDCSDDNLETDVTIIEGDLALENKGAGMQCFAKTQLSLTRSSDKVNVVLLEEPETHLSYQRTLELIRLIQGTQSKQLFISTHSDLIATRLDLKKCVLLNSSSQDVVTLSEISDDTARFFMKAPDNNMLQFVLSKKVILVEGDAEFILMEAMCKRTLGVDLADAGIGVIAVDGKCFKRYLEIAQKLGIKVAVITDNDKSYQEHIVDNYDDYISNRYTNIRIFADLDDNRYTFEVCVYKDNQTICDNEFTNPLRRITIQQYMLNNKAEAAYALLCNHADEIMTPKYIQQALRWINV